MAEVDVKFDKRKMNRFFSEVAHNVKGFSDKKRAYINAIKVVIFRDIIQHFEQEMGPDGKWKDWSESYAIHMQRRGKSGNQILQDTGRLRQNFKPTSWRTTGQGIEWFNDAKTKDGFPYAYAHDEGGKKLPRRSFMWLSDKAFDRVASITLAFVTKGRA